MHNFNQQCRNKIVIGHSLTENFDRKNKIKDAIKEILIIFSLSLYQQMLIHILKLKTILHYHFRQQDNIYWVICLSFCIY